ncbi:hypothetical protein N185_16035 [Sinorhizobium sp. GW3]|nr:hypothetical protein N185_16035 [Sinorhizobium sp. GW3]
MGSQGPILFFDDGVCSSTKNRLDIKTDHHHCKQPGWNELKVSKEKNAENRASLVGAAADLFARRGVEGTGVAEIAKSAGLTQGALYAHFSSKQELVAAALQFALGRANTAMAQLAARSGLEGLTQYYLSSEHCADVSGGCAMAAAASELSRQDKDVSQQLLSGFSELVEVVARGLDADPAEARRTAIGIIASLIGAVSLARGVSKADEDLASEILSSVKQYVGRSKG